MVCMLQLQNLIIVPPIDLYIGMSGSTNDSRMLRRSTLHYLASHGNLTNVATSLDGYSPYLIGDLGYPLLPWLMLMPNGTSPWRERSIGFENCYSTKS